MLSALQALSDTIAELSPVTVGIVVGGVIASVMAGAALLDRNHVPYKYGAPGKDSRGKKPSVPPGQRGEFHPSSDNSLWLFSRKWEPPEGTDPIATVTLLHGTVDHSGQYDQLGCYLASHGIAVFAQDMRGWGHSDGDAFYYNDPNAFVEDVASFYHRVHTEEYAKIRTRFILGKSIGGLIAKQAIEKYPDLWPGGFIALSASFGIHSDIAPSPVARLLINIISIFAPKTRITQVFGPKMMVSNALSDALDEWDKVPLIYEAKVPAAYLFNLLDGIDKVKSGQKMRIDAPVLMLWGTRDNCVSKEGLDLVLNQCWGAENGSMLFTYEGGCNNLLNEPKLKERVQRDIAEWILNRIGRMEKLLV